uniref:BZIP domain-containing protein n=1 Tax=Meloidogyne floridensis TaxID=298350 RepID=A0A915P3X2_9BILA
MSHSFSNHQRMATIPPNNLTICNIDGTPIQNAGNFLTNNSGAHSWQTEQTINLETINLDEFDNEHFNLLNFINDGSSPLEESGPRLEDDEIQKQKAEALYAQYQYDQMMFANQHLQQRNGLGLLLDSPDDLIDIYLSSDFGPNEFVTAPVPSSCFGEVGVGPRLEAGGPVRDEEEEEVRRRLLEPPNTSSLVPSTSNASMQKLLRVPVVKEEPFKDEPLEQDNVNVSQVFGSSSSRASSVASSVFTSVLSASHSGTPRKYRIKSDKEKSNPMYRLKRLKNNDAVRRSRDKARQQQMAKEHRLLFLEHEVYFI